jgi:hypothetical protein
MADPKFRTEITADPEPYKAGMDAAAAIAQQTAQSMAASMASAMQGIQANMQTGLNGIAGMFTKINAIVVGAGAVLATGGFAAGIKGAINLADELGKLSQKVGITVEELQFLKYAAEISNLPMEGLTKGLKKLSTEMFNAATGSKEARALFAGLGVEFESAPGKLKPTDEVLLQLADKFQKMEDGPVKAALAVKLFGREGLALIPFLNQGREGLERLRGEFKSLAGAMTGDMAASAEKFNDSLKTLELSSNKLKITMANALLPALNDITMAMTEAAKEGGTLYAIWVGMGGVMANLFKGAPEGKQLENTQRRIIDLQKQMNTPGMPESTRMAWQRQMNALLAEEVRLVAAIQAQGGTLPGEDKPAAARKPKVQPDLNLFDTTTANKTASRVPEWEGALAAWRDAFGKLKDEQGSAEQLSLEQERVYWKAVLDIRNLSEEESLAVKRKLYTVESELRKQAFDARIADLKAQMDAADTNAEQRIALASKVAALEIDRHKAGSKEAIDAVKDVQKAYDAWAKQQREIRDLQAEAEKTYQLSRVELERANLETLEQLGIIKAAEKIQRLKDLKQIEYTINLAELEREKELLTQGTVKYQEQVNKIAALKQKSVADMAALDNQAAIEAKKSMDRWIDPVASGFQTMINGMIAGTRKWQDVIRSTLVSVAEQYLATFAKIGADWVKTKIFENFFPDAAKAAGDVTTAVAAKAMDAAAVALSGAGGIVDSAAFSIQFGAEALEVAATAVETAAASISAAAAELAAAGAVSAGGEGLQGLGAVFQFAAVAAVAAPGGYDVPRGIFPVAQLHPEEMVLPEPLANRVRDMTDGGGRSGGDSYHITIVSPDTGGFRRLLLDNSNGVVQALKRGVRDGVR